MSLRGLFPLLGELPAYTRARDALMASSPPEGPLHFGVPDSGRALLLAALAAHPQGADSQAPKGWLQGSALVVATARPEDAQRWVDELSVYLGADAEESKALISPQVLLFPENEALPFERLEVDEGVVLGRLRVLAALAHRAPDAPPTVVVVSAAALRQRTLASKLFRETCHTLAVGQRVKVESLLARWVGLGYTVEPAVEVPGAVSRRGGILDIYPPHLALPARIELLGDAIESIRLFDPVTQLSQDQVKSIQVIPARELLPTFADSMRVEALARELERVGGISRSVESVDQAREEIKRLQGGGEVEGPSFYAGFFNTGSLLDYLSQEDILVLDEPQRIANVGRELHGEEEAQRRTKEERGELLQDFPSPNWPWEQMEEALQGTPRQLHLESLGHLSPEIELGFAPAPSFWGRLDPFARAAEQRAREGERVVVLSPHAQRLAEILSDQDVGHRSVSSLEEPPLPGSVSLIAASLSEGVVLPIPSGHLVILTDTEIFGRAKRRRPIRHHAVRREAFLSELTPGSYVVHVDHGIGHFVGTHQVETEQGSREYLTLEYAEGDRLYVPPEHLDRLSPYVALQEAPPTLTRLSTQEWSRAKERARHSAREMAQELLSLYAARQVLPGFAFSPDNTWQQELEDSFPYVETPDQALALADVKTDMEQPHPLDRLVCGDVGYGKTEIALRASFKAIQDGKQVALLCPTTILAQQHYATFTERLSPFPVRVEVLSRFRTEAEQQEVIEGLRSGSVDIVIGTQRLVQKDVVFKDLGLLTIDDEQRFGVAQKERFKQLRREVDVLTLTATPIPRTLYMALSGIRDMSTVQTPPESRQPVRTFVATYSDELVQEAVLRELDRGGQVFFLHNRVRDIHEWAARLQTLMPQARVAIGHGRMDEASLATTMAEFAKGKIEVLVCTTIIEAGLDLPNVNTLIVHRPELLGLGQMYQLRGRVGRGAHRAYAYFLVTPGHRLTDAADKRLRAILAHQELGSGFRIAMKDLEIRGAGNLLGPEQSGHIHALGFDLYVRLLEEAVTDLRRENADEPPLEPLPQVSISLPLESHIPEEYIGDLTLRLGVYQRLARATVLEQVEALEGELRDRFGPVPESVVNLLYTVQTKLLAGVVGVESVAKEGEHLALRLRDPTGGARPALQQELASVAQVGDRLIRMRMERNWPKELTQMLERLGAFRERLLALVGRPENTSRPTLLTRGQSKSPGPGPQTPDGAVLPQ